MNLGRIILIIDTRATHDTFHVLFILLWYMIGPAISKTPSHHPTPKERKARKQHIKINTSTYKSKGVQAFIHSSYVGSDHLVADEGVWHCFCL